MGTWGYAALHAPGPRMAAATRSPEWKLAKESKKGTWTVTCPCECEVCIVFYPVFARSSQLCASHSNMLIQDFVAKLARTSREVRANFT